MSSARCAWRRAQARAAPASVPTTTSQSVDNNILLPILQHSIEDKTIRHAQVNSTVVIYCLKTITTHLSNARYKSLKNLDYKNTIVSADVGR